MDGLSPLKSKGFLMRTLLTSYPALETKLTNLIWLKGLSLLAIRLYLAKFFLSAGLVKLNNIPAAIALFKDEYKVPVLPPELACYMAMSAEIGLSVLLIAGLLTRVAGLGFMIMTAVIATFVYPGVSENDYNLLLTGALIAMGGGVFSLDHLLFGQMKNGGK